MREGYRVRALVRPGSKTGFLESLGVEIQQGDLNDPVPCDRAVAGVLLGLPLRGEGWRLGILDERFRSAASTPRERLPRRRLDRRSSGSSTSARRVPTVIPPTRRRPIDETSPLGQNIWFLDHYTRSKVECEQLLWEMAGSGRLRLTIIRPSWLYRRASTGPRFPA